MKMSGIAGRTNYSDWNKKTNELLSSLEQEEQDGIVESKAALGHGKYAASEAEAKELTKAKEVDKMKQQLDDYTKREAGIVQIISSVLQVANNADEDKNSSTTRSGNVNIAADKDIT